MSKRSTSTRLAGLGFELAAAVAGFALLGYWIGDHYGNGALGLLIGAVLGLAGGMYNLIRASLSISGEGRERKRESDSRTDSR